MIAMQSHNRGRFRECRVRGGDCCCSIVHPFRSRTSSTHERASCRFFLRLGLPQQSSLPERSGRKSYYLFNARTYFLVAKHLGNRPQLASLRAGSNRWAGKVRVLHITPWAVVRESWTCTLPLVPLWGAVVPSRWGYGRPVAAGSRIVHCLGTQMIRAGRCRVVHGVQDEYHLIRMAQPFGRDPGRGVSVGHLGGLQDGTRAQASLQRGLWLGQQFRVSHRARRECNGKGLPL